MPKGYPILDESQKQEIVARVKKNGESVTDLAKEYGVHSKTIYQLLAKQVNQPNLILEIAKLRKEKEALLSIIGELVAEKNLHIKKLLNNQKSLKTMILEANILSKLQNKAQLARELGISRGVLYRDHKMPKKDLEIANKIRQVQELHPSYGYRRIALTLKINHKRALRVMQLFDLKSKRKTKIYKKVEKNLNEDLNKIEYKNLIINKKITKPNQVWSADFTYLPSDNKNHKFIFLATVIDCYTREILGFELSVKHDTNLVVNALFDAIKARRNKVPEIFHTDQGSEYKSKEFVNILQSLKIRLSFSNKASPWENGRQESFYQKFKLELGDPRNYNDLGDLFAVVSKQVFYYNNERIHTALKTSPSLFYLKYVHLHNSKN